MKQLQYIFCATTKCFPTLFLRVLHKTMRSVGRFTSFGKANNRSSMSMRTWFYALIIVLILLEISWSFLLKPSSLLTGRVSRIAAQFGPLHISEHLTSSLAKKGITKPSGIQTTSLVHIESGQSCILHAATGTGKTLCFSLPIMSRLYKQQTAEKRLLQTLVIVPSKELSIQIGADFSALERVEEPVVQVLASGNSTKEEISRPVVVSTAYKILDYLRALNNTERVRELLCNIETLVLDEVDRLIPTLGRYATYTDQRKTTEFVNPTRDLLSLINKARASHQQARGAGQGRGKGDGGGKNQLGRLPPLQVIACSATVGRPLRRELCNAFSSGLACTLVNSNGVMSPSRFDKEFPIIRPPDTIDATTLATAMPGIGKSESKKLTRLVGIPQGIQHRILVTQEDSHRGITSLAKTLIPLKELWVSDSKLVTGILFVPKTAHVEQAAAVLKAWGVYCLTDVTKLVSGDFSKRGALLKRPNKVNGKEVSPASTDTATTDSASAAASAAPKAPRKALLILPLSSSRGLHIPNVDCVLLSQPPKSMDEYLHAAGRTGRLGSAHPGKGSVYTVVTPEQQRCMHSWQTPLGIQFEDILV